MAKKWKARWDWKLHAWRECHYLGLCFSVERLWQYDHKLKMWIWFQE